MDMHSSIRTAFLRTGEFLADLLFPRVCIDCRKKGAYLCDSCLDAAPRKREHTCPFCTSVLTPFGQTCFSCAPKHSLDGIFAAVSFREASVIAQSIHIFKYEYVRELATPLGALLAETASKTDLPIPDFLVPVPLHTWRNRYRGFNQSSLLAGAFASSFMPELPLVVRDNILVRTRFTLPQAKSHGAKERKANLKNAFSIRSKNPFVKKSLKNKTVWLIDDVATTGATLEECAKTLKKAGVKKVFGIVVAR